MVDKNAQCIVYYKKVEWIPNKPKTESDSYDYVPSFCEPPECPNTVQRGKWCCDQMEGQAGKFIAYDRYFEVMGSFHPEKPEFGIDIPEGVEGHGGYFYPIKYCPFCSAEIVLEQDGVETRKVKTRTVKETYTELVK